MLTLLVLKDVEAHSGDTIDQIMAASKGSLGYKANIVLINAGTNDARMNLDIPHTGDRMRSLIESLRAAEGGDRMTIVLSTLIPSHEPNTATNRQSINQQYRALVDQMRREGVPIVLADMDPESPASGHNWISWPTDYQHGDAPDDTHPNDTGYAKMAYVFYTAILDASKRGYLKESYEKSVTSGPSCEKQYGDGAYVGITQRGSGEDDGIYKHKSQEMGIVTTVTSDYDRGQWFFARLYSE